MVKLFHLDMESWAQFSISYSQTFLGDLTKLLYPGFSELFRFQVGFHGHMKNTAFSGASKLLPKTAWFTCCMLRYRETSKKPSSLISVCLLWKTGVQHCCSTGGCFADKCRQDCGTLRYKGSKTNSR